MQVGSHDGKDFRRHYVFPFAQASKQEEDPNTPKDQHAGGDQIDFIQVDRKFSSKESNSEATDSQKPM